MEIKNQGKGIRLPGNLCVVRRFGDSIRVTIPRAMCEAILLNDRDIIRWVPTGKGLLLEKEKRTYNEFQDIQKKKKELERLVG
jgi:antitoxin component of MazEF toxin-antitoxin module